MADWVSLVSSNVAAIQYDDQTKQLAVRFHNGKVYTYSGVEQQVAREFAASPSPGTYFHNNIKGAYPTE